MGRTIVNGELLVNGRPVHETSIGSDPVTPVTTSSVADLIPDSSAVTKGRRGVWTKDSLMSAIAVARKTSSVVTVDASERSDLAILAEVIAEFGEDVITVGSAGLAATLAAVWGPGLEAPPRTQGTPQRVLIVASSLHDVTRSQIDTLSARRGEDVKIWAPSLREALDSGEQSIWLAAVRTTSPRHPIVVIDAPSQRVESDGVRGLNPTELIAQALAEAALSLIEDWSLTTLMLLGGEGARAVLRRLGAQRLHIHTTVREGIPIGTVEGGIAAGVTVITKAGGFGGPTDVADIAEELLSINTEGNR
jgi:uncharacterized protein YgbK (DUF1537 family)